jgi:hypothetical protein
VAVCCCSDSRSSLSRRGVLDGDDGLRREVRHQLDLFVGERAYLLTVDGKAADKLVLPQHWDVENRAKASKINGRHEHGLALDKGWLRPDVGNMNGLPGLDYATESGAGTRPLRPTAPIFGKCRRHAQHRSRPPRTSLEPE